MKPRFLCWLVCGLVVVGAFSGCPGRQEPAKPEAVEEPKAVDSPEEKKKGLAIPERLAALKELQATLAALPGKDLDADNQKMLAWLQGRPEYEEAGISSSGSVWARFRDGRIVVLARSQDADGQSTRGGEQGDSAPPAADQASKYMLPTSRQVRILNSPALNSPKWYLPKDARKWLEDGGYQVVEGDASIAGLKKVSGDGVFYIDTHGVKGGSDGTFAMITATAFDEKTEKDLQEDLDGGRVFYTVFPGSSYYGITHKFVTAYMSFADNAFVFLNCCHSFDEPFRKACYGKGASTYAGWTAPVSDPSAFRGAAFLFDRVLAANHYVPESPKQRPFDLGAVYREMRERNYHLGDLRAFELDDSEWPEATRGVPVQPERPPETPEQRRKRAKCILVVDYKSGFTFAGLRPNIASLTVWEDKDELSLIGYFGAKSGEVKIDGQSVTVKKWETTSVIVDLPRSGRGSAGPVVVHVDGRQSNSVPLTEWRGQFRYIEEDSHYGPTLKQTATFDVRFRADVHRYRLVPHETPYAHGRAKRRSDPIFKAVKDSKVQWEFSGGGAGTGAYRNNTFKLTGSGSYTLVERWTPESQEIIWGAMDAERHVVSGMVFALGNKFGTLTSTDINGRSSDSPQNLRPPGIDILEFDEQFTIKAGKKTTEREKGKIVQKLEWDAIKAKFLPGDDTQAALPELRALTEFVALKPAR